MFEIFTCLNMLHSHLSFLNVLFSIDSSLEIIYLKMLKKVALRKVSNIAISLVYDLLCVFIFVFVFPLWAS